MEPQHPSPRTELHITKVHIRRVDARPEEILKAYATITLNGMLEVQNLKIIQGSRGLFVSMPARRNKSGGFSDVVHPVNVAFRDELEDVVLAAYHGWEPPPGPPESLGIGALLPRPPRSGAGHAVNQRPVPVPQPA